MDDPDELDRPEDLNEEARGHVFLAKLSLQTGRINSMLDSMKNIVGLGFPLTDEERNLLVKAYEARMAEMRSAWRILKKVAAEQQRIVDKEDEWAQLREVAEETRTVTDHFRTHFVVKEFKEFCDEMAKVVRGVVLPVEERNLMAKARAAGASRTVRPVSESMVVYKKLMADSFRYLGEMAEEKEELEAAAEAAEGLYNDAKKNADAVLPLAHPLRLAVLLNMATFYYDVMDKPDRACKIASKAFREAKEELDALEDEEMAADATMVLVNLRDNLRLWATKQMELAAEEAARAAAREERRLEIEAQLDEEEATRTAQRIDEATKAHLDRARKARTGGRA